MSANLFTPITIGDLELPNRIVMAPMTRNRANQDNAPHSLNTKYYQQRATAGLIITEASQVSADGVGYPATPGIYSDAQVAGWREITDTVHVEGGHIFIQLWYCGRISHPDLLPDHHAPVAPSSIQPVGEAITFEGPKPFVTPHALETNEITDIIAQYKHAASMAPMAISSINSCVMDQTSAQISMVVVQKTACVFSMRYLMPFARSGQISESVYA